jgi:hypothetical protein
MTRYTRDGVYVIARTEKLGVIWMGRSRGHVGDHPFEMLIAQAYTWTPLPDHHDVPTLHVSVLGVRMDFNQLREVVLWVDTEAMVDVSVTAVKDVPGLLVRGADRIAVVASCKLDARAPETVLL